MHAPSNITFFSNSIPSNECLENIPANYEILEKYIEKLEKTGNSLIDEINGGGFYDPRCNRKRIKTKVCFIKYKPY